MINPLITIYLLIFASFFNCGNKLNETKICDTNKSVFTLSIAETSEEDKGKIETGEYTLPLKDSYVMTGAYDGIEMEFEALMYEYKSLRLIFSFPACETFNVYITNQGVKYETPEPPFTLTEKDFEGVWSDRLESYVKPKFKLQKRIKRANTHIDYIYFNTFKIDVREFELDNGKLSMSCYFEGEVVDDDLKYTAAKYKINGDFKISDYEHGYMEID